MHSGLTLLVSEQSKRDTIRCKYWKSKMYVRYSASNLNFVAWAQNDLKWAEFSTNPLLSIE